MKKQIDDKYRICFVFNRAEDCPYSDDKKVHIFRLGEMDFYDERVFVTERKDTSFKFTSQRDILQKIASDVKFKFPGDDENQRRYNLLVDWHIRYGRNLHNQLYCDKRKHHQAELLAGECAFRAVNHYRSEEWKYRESFYNSINQWGGFTDASDLKEYYNGHHNRIYDIGDKYLPKNKKRGIVLHKSKYFKTLPLFFKKKVFEKVALTHNALLSKAFTKEEILIAHECYK